MIKLLLVFMIFPIIALGSYYTPTASSVLYADNITSHKAQYYQDDGILHVAGGVSFAGNVDAYIYGNGNVKLAISLPISTALASAHECNGVAFDSWRFNRAVVYADPDNDRAIIEVVPSAAGDINNPQMMDMHYLFMCEII
jgi:hypothetical protein